MNHRVIAFAAAAVAAALLGSQIITPAPVSATPREPAAVCTVGGVAVADGEPLPPDIPVVVSCFASETEAQEFIQAGAPGDLERLMDGLAVEFRALSTERAGARASTVTIGKVWTGTSRGGSELIHWGTGSGCHGVTYGFPSLSSSWNDKIRSAEGFNNCWASHYADGSYGGGVLTCAPYCATLGFLAGQSSSIVYRPVGTFG
ncbi:hypothetical protein [Microbacterium sp. SLBN-111]